MLARLVLRYGSLKHSGEDFNKSRNSSLHGLFEFAPSQWRSRAENGTIRSLPKNALIRCLATQLSFIKNSVFTKGGHLTADNLSYIRIPKSASTSMCKAMLEKIYPTLKQKEITELQVNFLSDVNLIATGSESSDQKYFTIVRNPFGRLVSVYRGFFEASSPFYIYRDYLFGILPQHLSFSDFVNRIASIPDHLKDQHFKPQHYFLKYYKDRGNSVTTCKLEEEEKLNQFINQHNLQLAHLNKSLNKYDYHDYFDMNTFKIACKIYEADIKTFGYEKAVQALREQLETVH